MAVPLLLPAHHRSAEKSARRTSCIDTLRMPAISPTAKYQLHIYVSKYQPSKHCDIIIKNYFISAKNVSNQ